MMDKEFSKICRQVEQGEFEFNDFERVVSGHREFLQMKDNTGRYLIHLVAEFGSLKMLECMVEEKGQMNLKDGTGQTPLHIAARFGGLEKIDYLIGKGSHKEVESDEGETPLMAAIHQGKMCVAEHLIGQKCDLFHINGHHQGFVHMAAKCRIKNCLGYVLNCFCEDDGFENHINMLDDHGFCPLYYALKLKLLDNAALLIKKNANVNLPCLQSEDVSFALKQLLSSNQKCGVSFGGPEHNLAGKQQHEQGQPQPQTQPVEGHPRMEFEGSVPPASEEIENVVDMEVFNIAPLSTENMDYLDNIPEITAEMFDVEGIKRMMTGRGENDEDDDNDQYPNPLKTFLSAGLNEPFNPATLSLTFDASSNTSSAGPLTSPTTSSPTRSVLSTTSATVSAEDEKVLADTLQTWLAARAALPKKPSENIACLIEVEDEERFHAYAHAEGEWKNEDNKKKKK